MYRMIAALASLALAVPALAQDAPAAPRLELLYRSVVTLGETIDVGETARGPRRAITITGGSFEGPDLRGEILPRGWDWQLDREDGCTELEADYFIRTDDGEVINVLNRGTICRGINGSLHPVRTSPVFEAPLGKYDWLNKGAYVGTLGVDPGVDGAHVVITVYRAV